MTPNTPYHFSVVRELEGPALSLRPLRREDLPKLGEILVSESTWFTQTRGLTTPLKFIEYFGAMVDRFEKNEALTLVAREKKTGLPVAMSTFQYPSPGFTKVEIGFTWIADSWQRTFVNTEMKFLMLRHAFEDMRAARVEFSVHPENPKSNAAMLRIGAKFEGTLRKWRKPPGPSADNGDRNIYSIIDDEWPEISLRLQKLRNRN